MQFGSVLGGQNQMYTCGTSQLGEPCHAGLYVGWSNHHQIGQLISATDNVWHPLVGNMDIFWILWNGSAHSRTLFWKKRSFKLLGTSNFLGIFKMFALKWAMLRTPA
jgi:hypothetical protein